MTLVVYSVIITYEADILGGELDNIFPTAESAIKYARNIFARSDGIYEITVNEDYVNEEYGRHWHKTVFSKKNR